MTDNAATTEIADTPDASYPSPGKAWFLVILLTIAYIFSFVDRYILGLLIEPIKADLGLTDEEIGLIMGPAFGLLYVIAGLPVGWLVDRWRRTWIVGIGITIWSAATATCGLAQSFWALFTSRMTVGLGEATLSPSAFSMIADSFPPERRGKPAAFYTAALVVGSSIAGFIGASVLALANTGPEFSLPGLGSLAPWQVTFFIVGLPGLVVGVIFFLIQEPGRRAVAQDKDLEGNGLGDALKYVWQRKATYGLFVSLICVMTIVAYSQGFMPSAFARTWGWAPEKFAAINAGVNLIAGGATYLCIGIFSDYLSQKGIKDAPFRLMIAGVLILVPTAVIAMFMPSAPLAMACMALNTVGIATVSATGITALLNIIPAQIRGQVLALYYMTISLSGLFLGPTTVGTLSTNVFDEGNIRYAIAAVPILYGIIPILLIPITRKLYLAQMERLGTRAD